MNLSIENKINIVALKRNPEMLLILISELDNRYLEIESREVPAALWDKLHTKIKDVLEKCNDLHKTFDAAFATIEEVKFWKEGDPVRD